MIDNTTDQRSLDWFRARLGNITGSRVGDLMKSSKTKGELFGDTAKAYLYQLAGERNLNKDIVDDDDMFQEYLDQTCVTSKAMRFGTETEGDARIVYMNLTGNIVNEVSSCKHDIIPNFASSPDGVYYEFNFAKGCIEIKCPNVNTYIKYAVEINDNMSLKKVNPQYYYQCQSHMMCTGAVWCDFVIYCPWLSNPIKIIRITPDIEAVNLITDRVIAANEFIDNITSKDPWKKKVA